MHIKSVVVVLIVKQNTYIAYIVPVGIFIYFFQMLSKLQSCAKRYHNTD